MTVNQPGHMRLTVGAPKALKLALADRMAELRRQDVLAPITVLVGTSLQRPHLARWLAARLGGHANVRELRAAGYDLTGGGPWLDGSTDAPDKADALAQILATFASRRAKFYGPDDALLAADPGRLTGLD